ncbi:MAG: hypothetical protein LBU62_08980, partial [Bacteroidales bacterium]|nr:hypothetical protein [Bacteroidales bacterium]
MNLKHWQVFVILMGVPVIAPLAVFCQAVANSSLTAVSIAGLMDIGNSYMARMLAVLPFLTAIFVGLLIVWFYTMATSLHKKLPPTAKMSLAWFRLCLLFPAVFKVVTSIWLPTLIDEFWNGAPLHPLFSISFICLYLCAAFCVFYCFYFIAKALKTAELQQSVKFRDFAQEFFF